jgi:hypothetical protein
MRSALPFVVVGLLLIVVWFAIRPTGVTPDETGAVTNPGEAAVGAANGGGRGPVGVPMDPAGGDAGGERSGERGPREIAQGRSESRGVVTTEPPRPLPGAGEPDPDAVDRAIARNGGVVSPPADTGTTRGPGSGSGSPGGSPSGSPGGGVLTRALEESSPANQPTTVQPQPAARPSPAPEASRVRMQIDTARRLVTENDRVGARTLLSRVLRDPSLNTAEANLLRDELTEINQRLVFGRQVEPSDAITEEYKVASGDSLSRIASRRELATHWKLIQRVNGLNDPTKIRLGQTLKLVRGPFHAVVDKSEFRMDIWHGPPSDPSRWVYIRSFDVGLGEGDGTPLGSFVVSVNKLENPGWANPRDGRERYAPNDPKNPIGEFWLGLDGVGSSEGVTGYGIHGTIDPSSIGRNLSMGCVRLRDEDIAVVYELLAERVSRVEIVR